MLCSISATKVISSFARHLPSFLIPRVKKKRSCKFCLNIINYCKNILDRRILMTVQWWQTTPTIPGNIMLSYFHTTVYSEIINKMSCERNHVPICDYLPIKTIIYYIFHKDRIILSWVKKNSFLFKKL